MICGKVKGAWSKNDRENVASLPRNERDFDIYNIATRSSRGGFCFQNYVENLNLPLDQVINLCQKLYPAQAYTLQFLKNYTINPPLTSTERDALQTIILSIENEDDAHDFIMDLHQRKILDNQHRILLFTENFLKRYPSFASFQSKTSDEVFLTNGNDDLVARMHQHFASLDIENPFQELNPLQIFAISNFLNITEDLAALINPEVAQEFQTAVLSNKHIFVGQTLAQKYRALGIELPLMRTMLDYLEKQRIKVGAIDSDNLAEYKIPGEEGEINASFIDLYKTASIIEAPILGDVANLNPEATASLESSMKHIATIFKSPALADPQITSREHQVRINNLFVMYRYEFAFFLQQPGGLESMKDEVFPSVSDGCVHNISNVFRLALFRRMFKNPEDKLLYSIFNYDIFKEVLTEGATHHQQNPLQHQALQAGYISLPALIRRAENMLSKGDAEGKKEVDYQQFLAEILMDDVQKDLDHSSEQYKNILATNMQLVPLAVDSAFRDETDPYKDSSQDAVQVALFLALRNLISAYTTNAQPIDRQSLALFESLSATATKLIEKFKERVGLQNDFSLLLKSVPNADANQIDSFFKTHDFTSEDVLVFCKSSKENFVLFLQNLDDIAKNLAEKESMAAKRILNSIIPAAFSHYYQNLSEEDLVKLYQDNQTLMERTLTPFENAIKGSIHSIFSETIRKSEGKEIGPEKIKEIADRFVNKFFSDKLGLFKQSTPSAAAPISGSSATTLSQPEAAHDGVGKS